MAESGIFVSIRGNIEYSRLLTPIDGDELERDKARRTQAGIRPIAEPYTTIQITRARVLPRNPGGLMTSEEVYVDRLMFQRLTDGPNGDRHFACICEGASQPVPFYMADPRDPAKADPIYPEHELDSGLDVILILHVFESQASRKKGIRLHAVILQEPIRYLRQEERSL